MSSSDGRVSQSQRAGRDTSQQQAAGDIINVTVNLVQASEYLSNSRDAVIAREHSDAGASEARQRVIPYDAELLQVMADRGLLPAFADPALQRLITASRVEAASTERGDDRERLIELVAGRAKTESREVRACVSRAVAVVDDVDEAALRSLTYDIGGAMIGVAQPTLVDALDTWEQRLALVPPHASASSRWYEHLDALGLIRHSSSGTQMRAPLLDWMRTWGVPYFGRGATEAETAAVIAKCQQIAPGVDLPIIPHDLKPGFFRCLFGFRHEVEDYLSAQVSDQETVRTLALEVTNGILSWVEDHDLYGEFERVLESRPKVKAWAASRHALPYAISVTDVGRAMVWAELKRLGEDTLTLEDALHKPV